MNLIKKWLDDGRCPVTSNIALNKLAVKIISLQRISCNALTKKRKHKKHGDLILYVRLEWKQMSTAQLVFLYSASGHIFTRFQERLLGKISLHFTSLYHFSYSTLLLGHDIKRSELKLLQRPEDTRRNNVCKFKLYYSSKSPIHFFIIQAAWCHQAWAACDSVRLECILKCIDGFHVTSCHHTPEMDTALSY